MWFLILRRRVRTSALPAIVEQLELAPPRLAPRQAPARLSGSVARGLRLGPDSRRCLPSALVLYRLLIEQGDHAQLVIGLPEDATNESAHAWVEIDGQNIGPAPVASRHVELARYG